jgi:replication factor C large subunit
MVDWTEKYRPETLAEVRGNDKARDAFEEWAKTWEGHREAVILHGAPGVGKTSAAHALAADLGWDGIELNASDQRTADIIERVAGEAAKSGTLAGGSGGRKLVVLDEADDVHGNADRGGSRAITRLVKEASQPIVLIANEYYDMGNGLRNACRDIEFRDVSKRSIVPVLRDICRKEDIAFEDEALEALAEKNAGDLRSAINDLQALAETAETLTEADVVTGDRDRTKGIFEYLDELIKEADAETALRSSYDVEETPNDLINWIEDNVPKDYDATELAVAYDFLANADKWLGRVRATQDYSYWRYAGDNMAAGVAAARREPKGGWTRYGPPSYWSKLGRTSGTRKQRDRIARAIARESGTSMSTARREILPFLSVMTHHCKNRELTVAMAAAYEMDESDVAFVTGSGETTNKVASIVVDAEDLRAEALEEHAGGAFDVPEGYDFDDDPEGYHRDEENGETSETGTDGPEEDDGGGGGEAGDDEAQAGLGDFV